MRSSPSTTGWRTTSARGRNGSINSVSCWTSSNTRRRKEMEVTSSETTLTLPTDTQILITREFDAPKQLVYKAWTTPELIKRWWHANLGETTVVEIDLRPGGKWRYVMV